MNTIVRYIPGWPDRVGEHHGSVTCPFCKHQREACTNPVRYKTEFKEATCDKCGLEFTVFYPKSPSVD